MSLEFNLKSREKKGAHHSMKHFIYKQDVSPLKACSIINPLTPRRTLVAPFTKISILF